MMSSRQNKSPSREQKNKLKKIPKPNKKPKYEKPGRQQSNLTLMHTVSD